MKTKKLIGGVAVITNKGKHLLIKQSKHKPLCGYWRHPGGKFNNGESWENGLKREIKEELGINLIEINGLMVKNGCYDS